MMRDETEIVNLVATLKISLITRAKRIKSLYERAISQVLCLHDELRTEVLTTIEDEIIVLGVKQREECIRYTALRWALGIVPHADIVKADIKDELVQVPLV